MKCEHDLAERETACADGLCPLCLSAKTAKLVEALEQIKLGEGPYDRDEFMHACKTIDAMKAVAVAALAAAKASE